MTAVPALRIDGYVIVSADGMLANADGVMPDELKFEGDKRFFSAALDRADLIVHGRNSQEEQPNSPGRRRIILTRAIGAVAPDPSNPMATLWNPAGASFEAACAEAGVAFRHPGRDRRTGRVRHVHGPLRYVLAVAGAAGETAGRPAVLPRRARAYAAGDPAHARHASRRDPDAGSAAKASASRRGGGSIRHRHRPAPASAACRCSRQS